jgi:hypothetical protein
MLGEQMIANIKAKTSVIKFKVITEDGFNKITSFFDELKTEMDAKFSDQLVECLYEIKTGDQTYSGPSSKEFKKQYQNKYQAANIRLAIQATNLQQQLNPIVGRITLVLDRVQESSLSVLGEDINWVNGVFSRFNEIVKNVPTKNVILHNVLFEMSVQLLAITILTIFSIFLANRLASLVRIEFSEVYIFVIAFLLLSNLWRYVTRALTTIRNKYYPVVDITRVPRKPILLSVIIFVSLAAASWAVGYILDLLVSST